MPARAFNGATRSIQRRSRAARFLVPDNIVADLAPKFLGFDTDVPLLQGLFKGREYVASLNSADSDASGGANRMILRRVPQSPDSRSINEFSRGQIQIAASPNIAE
jgi:hypothetical protein